ncbi:hypothetical protein IQ256_08470 [cf. Phormidesmis sp. LEGE 11477]|nr:hypothetical protein [cf. Phormidesmis sp. LEGE 11477]
MWRQGSILARKDFQVVGLSDDSEAEVAVVISHDCDIANNNLNVEPSVEFIIARIIAENDGNCTYGKNPRTLHLDYICGEETVHLELTASRKSVIQKSKLEAVSPDETYYPSCSNQILQSWLASRYRRHALPNSLVARLSKVFSYIEKEGKKNANGILSFHIDYEPREELSPKEPYELWINIVHVTDESNYCEMCKQLALKLKEKFPELLKKTENEGTVDLRRCEAISEAEFTLRDMRETVEFRLDHLSYRAEPFGPVT